MKKAFLFIIFYSVIYLQAQCPEENTTYKAGEKITYKAVYNWGWVWLDAGKVFFNVNDAYYNGKNVYHFETFGTSYKSYDYLFKVRDYFDTWVDKETLLPLKYIRNTSEGGYVVNNKFWFDYDANKIYTYSDNNEKELEQDTFDLTTCVYDVLSAVYYVRTIDYSQYKVNDKIPVTFILDNEIFDLYIRYLGKETIKNQGDGKKYRCIKFSAMLVEGTIFSAGEDLFVWVTDDDNKIPVLIEAKILIGSVKAVLSGTENLRHPIDALIED